MPGPGPRTTYKCSERFKATAVRLSELRGVSVQDVASRAKVLIEMLLQSRHVCDQ
jgi:transposase